jgi:hypothetical protein
MSAIGQVTVVPAGSSPYLMFDTISQTTILDNIIIVSLFLLWVVIVVYIVNKALVHTIQERIWNVEEKE